MYDAVDLHLDGGDSLCELHFRQEKTELAAVLAYEAKR
ncbi:TPA: Hok/Gef family protein [Enterobacter hormaechei]